MKLSEVYHALDGLRKHQDLALSPNMSKYLQDSRLIKVIPAVDYEALKKNYLQYDRLERRVGKLSDEIYHKGSEADLIKGNLGSFLYRLFKTKETLNAKSQELSKLEKELICLNGKIGSKKTEMKSKEEIVDKLEKKYNIEDYDSLRRYSRNGHGYIALTALARYIMPLVEKELKEKPNRLYETFKENLKRISRKRREEGSDDDDNYSSSRRRDDDDDDDSYSSRNSGFGIGGFGMGGGGFSSGGFSGGGGSFGGGGASGKW